MPTHNSVVIAGHLGRDAETKHLPSGHALTTFSVAVTKKIKDKEKTIWVDCKVWNQSEEAIAALTKGCAVIVIGEIDVETWEDRQTGFKRSKTLVLANAISPVYGRKKETPRLNLLITNAEPAPAAQAVMPMEITDDDVPF